MQEPEIDVKPCVKCGARDRYKNGGCRPCAREAALRWQKANPDKVREASRRRYEANPDKVREAVRRWREANPDKVRERVHRWREANPDKVREASREASRRYREANLEKRREAVRSWREANPDKARAAERRWKEANPDKVRETKRRYREANPDVPLRARHNRRARKSNPNYPDDKLSRGLKKKLMKLQGGKCAYSNAPLAHWCAVDIIKENHMDHIMPLKLNGRNIDSNMQLTCPACNHRKNDSHPDDFARRVGLII